MNIVMHCGGLPFNGKTIETGSLGGSETAAYYTAKELAKIGHDVILFTNSPDEGTWDNVMYVYAGNLTEQTPLGDRFERFALNTPHDILIIQRHLTAFSKRYASKVNILWLHDLALHRQKGLLSSQMHNVDAVFVVSEYHKKQVCDVYGINPSIVFPVKNGVDVDLYTSESLASNCGAINDLVVGCHRLNKKILTYSSRPERGLANLVGENGIMEQLLVSNPEYQLFVCGYDNTVPQMAELYDYLWKRCELLQNVTNVGPLNKKDLAYLQMNAFLHVYPTEFEEVSCITVMECHAAKTPILTSSVGAIPETSSGTGTCLIDLKDGKADVEAFVSRLREFDENHKSFTSLKSLQLKCSGKFSWSNAVTGMNNIIDVMVDTLSFSQSSLMKHMIHMSDIVPLDSSTFKHWEYATYPITKCCIEEIQECYDFYLNDDFENHYKKYYEYEKNRGVNYGPEILDGNQRYEVVSSFIQELPAGSVVLDFGCAHGHYTINLAKRFPFLEFIGVDLAESNIKKARKWSRDEELTNVTFEQGDSYLGGVVDCVIAAEVLEHVKDATDFMDKLHSYLDVNGIMVITTPYGPWEASGYISHWPWRAHVYHFERADLVNMFGHFDGFDQIVVPAGHTSDGEALGSFVTTYKVYDSTVDKVKEYKKIAPIVPARQTLTLAMLVKDAEQSIERCLNSVVGVVDEIIIGLDETTSDSTESRFYALMKQPQWRGTAFTVFKVKSPIEVGFSEARNDIIEKAAGDWILWLDSDEEFVNSKAITPLLRRNQFNAYAVQQNHFSNDPVGVLKVDLPAKIFRNNIGIKFYGRVHEHPELEINTGIEYTCITPLTVIHYGYSEENIRRERFKRNLSLLAQDREENPERPLGMFLWIRDLSQMNSYELEQTGKLSEKILERAREAVEVWRHLLDVNLRMAFDALQYYSACVQIQGLGFEVNLSFDVSKTPNSTNINEVVPVKAFFLSNDHLTNFFNQMVEERTKDYESKYF